MDKLKNSVGTNTRYYKYAQALAVIDHAHAFRCGKTNSVNVNHDYTKDNLSLYVKGCRGGKEVLDLMCSRYKSATGKKPRNDFNILFEHIVFVSEEQFIELENQFGKKQAKRKVMEALVKYADSIKCEFGFEPMSINLHLDEGHSDAETGVFVRNVHAHVHFFNYCFKSKKAPLRHLMKKGKNEQGKTNQLNGNFVRMQDIAASSFESLGFARGVSKSITDRKHLSKEIFVKQKLKQTEKSLMDKQALDDQIDIQVQKKQDLLTVLDEQIGHKKGELSALNSRLIELQKVCDALITAIKEKCRKSIFLLNTQVLKISKNQRNFVKS